MRPLLTLLALLALLLLPARAAGLEEAAGVEEFRRASESYLDGYLDIGEASSGDFAAGAKAILDTGSGELPGILRRSGRSGALLLAVTLLCAVSETLRQELGGGGLDPIRLAGAAAVTAIAVIDVNALLGLGRQAMERMDEFSRLLLPVVTALCAAGGQPAAAVARQGATLLFLNLLLTVADKLILPLIYAYVAACAAHAALGNDGLRRVGELLKWAAGGLLSLLFTGFVVYLTVSGAVAGNADALTQKAAKTAISGMVPVVGGILSDAAETVVAGAGVLKGTVGVVGLLAVLCVCLVPFLQLGCHYLVYKLSAALCATVSPGPTACLVDAIGSAFALVLGMTGGGAMILYVALITSIKAVGG